MRSQNPLPKVSEHFASFPLALINHLRLVTEAASPSDAFACYCNLLEWLTTYLANLANSVYKARSVDEVDERLEQTLRGSSTPVAFGGAIAGLRAFAASPIDFESTIPELGAVLRAPALPTSCIRLVRAFALVRRAREGFDIPPSHLARFVDEHLPNNDKSLGRANFDAFLGAIVLFRNKGHGHQAEESWFPRDHRMYSLVLTYLDPAVDDLLTWEPFRDLLGRYEVVDAEISEARPTPEGRACPVSRTRSYGPYAPLGPSRLLLGPSQRLDEAGAFVARRGEQLDVLRALVRYVHFPSTLQTSELQLRRYARHYLLAYLDRGLITPSQRDDDLTPLVHRLALAERDQQRYEGEIQAAINHHASDDPGARSEALQRLQALVGPAWPDIQERVQLLLEQLPARRKDYVFEQVVDNVIMSFDQLRAESELSEPDLDTVLAELEQEGRVRRVGAGNQLDRAHGHYKAQDPQKPASFRAILAALRDHRARPRRGFPEPVWRLVQLCAELLGDDGLTVDPTELESHRVLFDLSAAPAAAEPSAGEAIPLRIDGRELRPTSIRELFEQAWAAIRERGIDPTPALPLLLGKTRYLVSREPVHANGTPFGVPYPVADVFFEGNLTRAQALAEVLRLLQLLGLAASSPEIEPRAEPEPGDTDELALTDDEADDVDEGSELPSGIGLAIYDADAQPDAQPAIVRGPTVRRFLAALLAHLLQRGAPLADLVPVRAGRIRYFLSEEPYHQNGRPFDAAVERGGYFINTAFSYDQAIAHAQALCRALGLRAQPLDRGDEGDGEDAIPLTLTIGDTTIDEPDVPNFLYHAVATLYAQGILRDDEIPYKSGRVRYLIAEIPTHDHGRDFIRPVEIDLDGKRYFIESNVSRRGAIELVQRIIASKQAESAGSELT